MIAEILIRQISRTPVDYERIKTALMLCKEKEHLTKQELMQLHEAGLPVGLILNNILPSSEKGRLDSMIGLREITYADIMCIIGIIAQDCRLQEQKKGIHL